MCSASKRRSIVCLSLAILVIGLGTAAYATETRVGSMGGVGLYVRDNSNVLYFPGTLIRYADQGILELRMKNIDESYTLGGHASISPTATIGVYLNRPLDIPITGENVELDRITELLYGFKTQSYDMGLKLGLGLDSYSRKYASSELNESVRQFSLGGGLSNEQMDLGLTIDLLSLSAEEGNEETSRGGFGVGANGRMFMGEEEGFQLVPVGTLYYGSASDEYDSGITGVPTDKTDYGMFNLGLGVGVNRRIGPQNLVVAAVQLLNLSSMTEDERGGSKTTSRSVTMPGLYLGAESTVRSWLVARLGAAQLFQSYHTKTEPAQGTSTETNSRDSIFNVMFGLGVKVRGIEIDASLNEGLFFDGPNFLTGSDEPLAYKLSMTYRFGGSPASEERSQAHSPEPTALEEPMPETVAPDTTQE